MQPLAELVELGMRVNTQPGRITESKASLLDEAGYAYSFDRQMYVNRGTKKVFSIEFIQDSSEDEIRSCINEHTGGVGWQFYFNNSAYPDRKLPDSVRRELESVLA